MSFKCIGVWLAASMVLAGCDSGPAGSCDWRTRQGNRCFDYASDAVAIGRDGCATTGVWADKPCDLAGSIGGCKMSEGTTKWLFSGGAITTRQSAASECTEWLEPTRK